MTWASSFIEHVASNPVMLSVAAIGIAAIVGRLAFGVIKRFTGR